MAVLTKNPLISIHLHTMIWSQYSIVVEIPKIEKMLKNEKPLLKIHFALV